MTDLIGNPPPAIFSVTYPVGVPPISISLQTDDPNMIGTYDLKVTATLSTGAVSDDCAFTVSVLNTPKTISIPPNPVNQYYVTCDGP